MEITIKESAVIRPSQDTPKKSLWISNLDLVILRYHVPTIYFYEPTGSSNFMDPKILKESLSRIMVDFYPIAERLGYDENGRLEIVCNGEGVLFVEAEASSSMECHVGYSHNSDVIQLIPKVDYSKGISSFPPFCCTGTRTFQSPNLAVNSRMWLPIYDADFGWGRPVFMRPATVAYGGAKYLIPSLTCDGSTSIVIRLKPSQMELFKELLCAI